MESESENEMFMVFFLVVSGGRDVTDSIRKIILELAKNQVFFFLTIKSSFTNMQKHLKMLIVSSLNESKEIV